MSQQATTIHNAPVDLESELQAHRAALTAYCYRMLGSAVDADDAVQETMLRAWRGLARYEGRAPLRSWLYRIATNVCLDALSGRQRRALPMDLGPPFPGNRKLGGARYDIPWMGPIPGQHVIDPDADPAEQASTRESIRLAFVAALQHLRPKARAVLILRDVVGWPARDVADTMAMTPAAVHCTVQRARRVLAAQSPPRPRAEASLSDDDQELLARYVDAFSRYDIDTLVELLHEHATMAMPPNVEWMRGRDTIERWWRGPGSACRDNRIISISANGTSALALYRHVAPSIYAAHAIQVVEVSAGYVTAIHNFVDSRVFTLFDLPAIISEQHVAQPGEPDQLP